MPRPRNLQPAYNHHKASGRAYVTINGKMTYLGLFGSAESKTRYHELVAQYHTSEAAPVRSRRQALLVADLVSQYVTYAQATYVDDEGQVTNHFSSVQTALIPVVTLFGELPVKDFGPLKLKTVQEHWEKTLYKRGKAGAEQHLSRTTIAKYFGIVRGMFAWGVSQELVPETVYRALLTVKGLKQGRTMAAEPKERPAVGWKDVHRTLRHLARPLRAMVLLQWLTGMRPSEVRRMRVRDIDATKTPWLYTVAKHKTMNMGIHRLVYLGPYARKVIRPFLEKEPDAYLFSPQEALAEQRAAKRSARKSPMTPSQKKREEAARRRKPRAGECYTKNAYTRALRRACEKHDIPVWTPYQLRHSGAERIKQATDLATTQAVLGHRSPATTKRYLSREEQSESRAIAEVMERRS